MRLVRFAVCVLSGWRLRNGKDCAIMTEKSAADLLPAILVCCGIERLSKAVAVTSGEYVGI